MPTLTIDKHSVTVPAGTNVLEAAKSLGIVIPHFCYHEALGAVGACRLCAMTFEEGPVKGIQMSCMVEAKDGMVVSTVDPKAAELRAHVIEWLMMNHPHDCPVCDEGGECQLQDMTIAGGHGLRRYRGKKRTFVNQDLGPFVEQEMNRCIQCYRCVRTYQDYCGGTDFGVLGSRDRLFFGRFRDGALESTFSGNLVDVCPTGVFTDKTFRFRSRAWDLEEAPSVCPHCSLGCAVIPGARYRELQRVRAGVNGKTNGFFICDRGRFGYGHANHPDRPRVPRLDGREASWPAALTAVRQRIEALVETHGPQSVALLGSPRASLEANALLGDWARRLGGAPACFECHPGRDRAARAAAAGLDRVRSLEEIRGSDLVILAGADPLAEGPMLALALRQAVRQGGQVAVLDPRPVSLPCEASHLPLSPERLPAALAALSGGDLSPFSRKEGTFLEGLRGRLERAERPVMVGGADLLGAGGVTELLAAAATLDRPGRPCGAAFLLAGPNSCGSALLAGEGPDGDHLLDAIQAGTIRALICLEADPFGEHPDPGRAQAALARLELLVALESMPTQAARRADVLLPVRVPSESAGTVVNFEGRILPFGSVFEPGIPLAVTGGGDHPPRVFEPSTPGSSPRPAWAVLAALQGRALSLAEVRRQLAAADPRFASLPGLQPGGEGTRVAGVGCPAPPLPTPLPACRPEGTLRLLPVEAPYGSELLSSLSAPLAAVMPEPFLQLSGADAERLGFTEGGAATLVTSLGRAAVAVRVAPTLPEGLALLPRLRGSSLEQFIPGGAPLYGRLEKGEGP